MDISVDVLREASDEVVAAMARLLPQLSSSAGSIKREALTRVVMCRTNHVLVARDANVIVGTLTLTLVPLITGMRARIEDVVVDEAARGRGVGASLTEEAIRIARDAGARTINLTSRPERAAANRLYERLGFQQRESQVYRLTLEQANRDQT